MPKRRHAEEKVLKLERRLARVKRCLEPPSSVSSSSSSPEENSTDDNSTSDGAELPTVGPFLGPVRANLRICHDELVVKRRRCHTVELWSSLPPRPSGPAVHNSSEYVTF